MSRDARRDHQRPLGHASMPKLRQSGAEPVGHADAGEQAEQRRRRRRPPAASIATDCAAPACVLAPMARSRASSWVRCATRIAKVLLMMKAPTSSATTAKTRMKMPKKSTSSFSAVAASSSSAVPVTASRSPPSARRMPLGELGLARRRPRRRPRCCRRCRAGRAGAAAASSVKQHGAVAGPVVGVAEASRRRPRSRRPVRLAVSTVAVSPGRQVGLVGQRAVDHDLVAPRAARGPSTRWNGLSRSASVQAAPTARRPCRGRRRPRRPARRPGRSPRRAPRPAATPSMRGDPRRPWPRRPGVLRCRRSRSIVAGPRTSASVLALGVREHPGQAGPHRCR